MVHLKIQETHDYDLRLGRHIDHDERSFNYDVTPGLVSRLCAWATAKGLTGKSFHWERYSPILDQGQLGSCTGNAMTGLLACEPFCHSAKAAAPFNEDFAVELYSQATVMDEFIGTYPPTDTGSSGLAVAKVVAAAHLIDHYRWAFTTNSLIYALKHGPVIVGVPWFESMFNPNSEGRVVAIGDIVGGHEFLIRGYEHGLFYADNSWGNGWGINGSFKFSTKTWETLRTNKADVTVPIPNKFV